MFDCGSELIGAQCTEFIVAKLILTALLYAPILVFVFLMGKLLYRVWKSSRESVAIYKTKYRCHCGGDGKEYYTLDDGKQGVRVCRRCLGRGFVSIYEWEKDKGTNGEMVSSEKFDYDKT